MSNPPPDVHKLIDEFAERLLALAGGEQIPVAWKRYLTERLAPKPKPLGRPMDPDCLEMIAYEIARRYLEDKNGKEKALSALPVQEKRRIAAIYGVNARTITNMQRIVENPGPALPDEQHDAVIRGFVHAIHAEIKRKDQEEARRRKARLSNERWVKLMEMRRGVGLGKK
jgi:hypothetical protein